MNQAVASEPQITMSAPKTISTGKEYSIDSKIKGTVRNLVVREGDVVKRDDVLLTLTNYFSNDEYKVYAYKDSIVQRFVVREGQIVNPNDKLVILAETSSDAEVLPPVQDDDFFGEFSEAADNVPVNTSPSDGDFFDELGTAVNEEFSAEKPIIDEARKYFINGEFRKAERLLENVVDKGHSMANYIMGIIYEYGGDGIEVNESRAMHYFDDGTNLTGLHAFNFFVKENHPRYKEVCQLIMDNMAEMEKLDDPFLKFELGYFWSNIHGRFDYFKNYLSISEQQGYWLASFWLGFAYEKGVFGRENYKKACEHYVRAANKGMIAAAKGAGIIYKYAPEGVQQDLRLAKKYLLIAANQNEEKSMYELAGIYGNEGNFREAINWLEKNISTNNSVESAAELGIMLLNITENPKIHTDYQRSYQLCQFALSKDENNSEALCGMGFAYLAGEAVQANEQTARHYFNLAVEKGSNSVGVLLAKQALENLKEPPPQNQNSGCFITTAVCDTFGKSDDCYELTTFRKFRDEWLTVQPDGKFLIAEYYEIAPRIVANINRLSEAKKIYKNIWKQYLVPCLNFINCGDNFSCKQKYIDMVHDLKRLYL